jgi:hypothetical protein
MLVTVMVDRQRWLLAATFLVALAVGAMGQPRSSHAVGYPLCGGRAAGTVCQQSLCGTVPAGVECLLPLCGTLPPGTPFGAPCVDAVGLPACSTVPADTLCQPDNETECGLVPEGYPCLRVGDPIPDPPCGPGLAVDTFCQADDGNSCRVVAEGQFACLVVGRCTGPDHIVQACQAFGPDALGALFTELRDRAVAGVLENHQLPASDAPRVMTHARDSVRAHLFVELLNVIQKEARSPAEEALVKFYADKVVDLRARQAQASEAEYQKFAASPCAYTPPTGYTFEKPTNCATALSRLWETFEHPSLKEFISYGITMVSEDEIIADAEALRIAAGTREGVLFGASLAVAGIIAASVYVVLFGTAIGASLAAAIAPFAVVPFTIGALAGVAAGVGTVLIAVAGAVFAILLLIVGTTFAVIDYVEYDAFVNHVTSLTEGVNPNPDLRVDVKTERGMADLYHVFVKSTQPDWPAEGAVPASGPRDPQFRISVYDPATGTLHGGGVASTLLLSTIWGKGQVLQQTVGLHRGWFRSAMLVATGNGPPQGVTTLSLGITIVDWEGKTATAWRRGDTFVVTRSDANGKPLTPVVSEELQFLAPTGAKFSARIVAERPPPAPTRPERPR